MQYLAFGVHTAVAGAACVAAPLAAVPAIRRGDRGRAWQIAARVLLAGAVAAVLAATLLGASSEERTLNLIPGAGIVAAFESPAEAVRNVLGNVALFVPLGFLAVPALRRGKLAVAGLGAALSVVIEVCQFVSGRRWADVDDVLLNTAGAYLGAVAYLACTAVLLARRRRGVTASRAGRPR